MNATLEKIINFLLRRKTVNDAIAAFTKIEAQLAAAAEREVAKAAAAKAAAAAAEARAKAALAESERADRIAQRVRALTD